MFKILFVDSVHPLIQEALTLRGFTCDYFPGYKKKDFERVIHAYQGIIIRSGISLDRSFLEKATALKFIGRVGAGMENIDVHFAGSRGVICLNAPEGNRDAVGEHALGMLLAIMNNMVRADLQIRQGIWMREGNRGVEIKGKTAAIIGYGNMGSAFAQRLKGFEARVIAYDKYKSGFSDDTVEEVSMNDVYKTADIVSLHVPLTEETHYLADETWFQGFRKPIYLINASRGPVVNTTSLVGALKSGKVAGAALDVLEYEDVSFETLSMDPPADLQFLMNSHKVILSPHIAGWTVESNIRLAQVLVDKIISLSFVP